MFFFTFLGTLSASIALVRFKKKTYMQRFYYRKQLYKTYDAYI